MVLVRATTQSDWHSWDSVSMPSSTMSGFPLGNDETRRFRKASRETPSLLAAFVRGFYNAEGSIYRRYSKRCNDQARVYDNLLNIQVRTKMPTLMRQVHRALVTLGIRPTRLVGSQGVYTFRITDQTEVARFMDIIRPKLKTAPRTVYLGRVVERIRGPVAQPGLRE